VRDPVSGEIIEETSEGRLIRVRRGRQVEIGFDLGALDCPVDVDVSWNGRLPRDAAVAVRGREGELYDVSQGPLRLHLSKGSHCLAIGSGDRVIERTVQVDSFQPTRIAVEIAEEEKVVFKGCPPAVEPYLLGDVEAAAHALERDGQERSSHALLAQLHRRQGRNELAAQHFELAEQPAEAAELWASISNYRRAASLFERAEVPERAAEMYRAAREWVQAGEAYEAARRYDAAIDCYREAGEVSKWIDALERRGDPFSAAQIALEHGERASAIRLLRLIPPEDPHFPEACLLLADAFEHESHWDLAAQKLEEHIAAAGPAGRSPDLQSRLASLLERSGDLERALSLLEELRRREPTYPNVATHIEMLRKKRSDHQRLDERPSAGADPSATSFQSEYRYQILEEIGRGGMAVVFKARDRRLSREVALKRLPETLRNYPKAVQLFLREAQATARLNHRNIVIVYDADQEDGTFFITMELLSGRSLHRLLHERGRLSVPELARIGSQISAGLDYAHQNKVVHRDIKTANLFLTDDDVIKIMDFGLATTLEEVRREETGIGGTPSYMSPEQVAGGSVDHRTDLYSLGVTLFELATGRLPFEDGDVLYHHRHTPPPNPRERNPDLPGELSELILRLLEKRVEARCSSAGEVERVMQRWIDG
jgi:tRNA A-37 threonylcarbamoyl transferase component Bud32